MPLACLSGPSLRICIRWPWFPVFYPLYWLRLFLANTLWEGTCIYHLISTYFLKNILAVVWQYERLYEGKVTYKVKNRSFFFLHWWLHFSNMKVVFCFSLQLFWNSHIDRCPLYAAKRLSFMPLLGMITFLAHKKQTQHD